MSCWRTHSSCWTLKPGEEWHGYQDEDIADDYCMLDPTKVTILIAGRECAGCGWRLGNSGGDP